MIVLVLVTLATVVIAFTFVFRFDTWRIAAWPQTFLPLLAIFAGAMTVSTVIADKWFEATLFALCFAVFVAQVPRSVSVSRDLSIRPSNGPSLTPITILHANVLYLNTEHEQVIAAMLARDADIITICELNDPWHHVIDTHQDFTRTYPSRITAPAERADGIAVYSKFPIARHEIVPAITKNAIVAEIVLPAAATPTLTIITGHPMPPVNRTKTRDWRPSFIALRDLYLRQVQEKSAAVVIGDFNATHWHPSFKILSRELRYVKPRSFRSNTWRPRPRWPHIARLDHALISHNLDPVSLETITIPGSDHRGLVLEVALTGITIN